MADQISLADLLGGGLPPGLLSAEQEAAAERRAQNAALLNTAFGLLQASRGQPGMGRPSLGQIIGQAGPVGVQAYQQSFDDTLKRALQGMQIGEARRKQLEAEQLRTLLPQVFQVTREPSTTRILPAETGDITETIPGGISNIKIDPTKLQALMAVPGGAEAVKGIAEAQKLVRQAGLGAGQGEIPSPFAVFTQAGSPQVRELAKTYDLGFRTGRIDEDTADKRIKDLGEMEQRWQTSSQAEKDRALRAAEMKQEHELKREEGTGEQRKAAGFAQIMVQSDNFAEKLTSQFGNKALPTTYTSAMGSIPFIGGRAERAAMSSEQQQYKNAADAWIGAKLRFESGAAIGQGEIDKEYGTYFPVPGDSKERIEQKAELRKTATANMIRNAGQLFKPVSGLNIKDIRSTYGLE